MDGTKRPNEKVKTKKTKKKMMMMMQETFCVGSWRGKRRE